MNILKTSISNLMLVESAPITDLRGAFARLYCEDELSPILERRHIVQINQSYTALVGTVRGLHFQFPPHAEMKMVYCLKGGVWDVAIDLRKNSPTLFCWHAEKLTSSNNRMMVLPEGFAHGFQVLEPETQLLYLHTAFYSSEEEGGLCYNDPKLNISWPLEVTDLSVRDANHPLIDDNFEGITI